MNCKNCKEPYSLSDENKLPRVLTLCGHTFCHNCVNNKNSHFTCYQCQSINQRTAFNFPVNQTLRAILHNCQKQSLCQIHGKKLQAYCEKDNQLLCLNCVLATHKTHKVSSISEKVQKDKEILKNSYGKIQKNKRQYQIKLYQCENFLDEAKVQYNDYLLDISLLYKQIINEIKDQEQKAFQKSKNTFQKQISKINTIQQQLKEKIQFCSSLNVVYEDLIKMDDITYLNEDNQRIFIVQNSILKNFKIQNPKIELNKVNLLYSVNSFIQQMIFAQKNKLKSQKKQNVQAKQSVAIGSSPSFSKKSRARQPQILQVNLSQQYQKHQMIKNKSKFQTKKNSVTQKQITKPKQTKFINSKKINQSRQFTISVFSQEQYFQNKDSFQLEKYNLGNLTPMSINSFMNSSQQTIKDSFSLKNSKASFTLIQQQQCVYHFGGLGNNTVQKVSLNDNSQEFITTSIINNACVNRSKSQVVYLKSFSKNNCFILGGKNQQGDRLNSVLSFNFQINLLQQTQLKLSQPKSGFGAFVKNQKIFVVGGSSNSSLNTLEQYKVGSSGFQCAKLASMTNSRDQLGFTLGLDGFLYVGGGINNSNSILNSCQKYCFKKNKWTSIASMKIARRSFSMVALPNAILAIGGHDGKQPLCSVQMLQYDSNRWIQVAPLSKGRFTHTSIYSNNYENIMVFGGYEQQPLKSVQVYNVLLNKWVLGKDLKQNRFLHCSLLLN